MMHKGDYRACDVQTLFDLYRLHAQESALLRQRKKALDERRFHPSSLNPERERRKGQTGSRLEDGVFRSLELEKKIRIRENACRDLQKEIVHRLSAQELPVLWLLKAEGCSIKETAKILGISEGKVQGIVKSTMTNNGK